MKSVYKLFLLFADDQVIMDADDHDIEYIMRKFVMETRKMEFINFDYKKDKVIGGNARDLHVQGRLDLTNVMSIINWEIHKRKGI